MYQHILLAVALQRWDTVSPYALVAREVAVALAQGAGAKLSVLSVYDYELLSVYGDDRLTPPGLPPELVTRYWEDHRHAIDVMMAAKMEAFLAGIRGVNLPIAPILAVGESRETIVTMAETLRADLLIIGTHSKRNVFHVVLGGTAAHVSRHTACPVLMVKPGERPMSLVRA
jgi:nucleotide-binding universal stress UspA family protein